MQEQGYDYYALQLLASANLLTACNFSDVTIGRAKLEKKIFTKASVGQKETKL